MRGSPAESTPSPAQLVEVMAQAHLPRQTDGCPGDVTRTLEFMPLLATNASGQRQEWILKSFCSCPGTHSIDQSGLELRPASASQVLRLKACTAMPGQMSLFNKLSLIQNTALASNGISQPPLPYPGSCLPPLTRSHHLCLSDPTSGPAVFCMPSWLQLPELAFLFYHSVPWLPKC